MKFDDEKYPVHDEKHELLPKRVFGKKKHSSLSIDDVNDFFHQIKMLIKENEDLKKEISRLKGKSWTATTL